MNIKQNIMSRSRKEKEAWLLCVFPSCPNTKDNPIQCHIHCIRKQMSFSEYNSFIKSKSDLEIDEFLLKHFECKHNK